MNNSLLLAERLQYRHRPRAWRYVSDSEPPTPPSLDYFDHELRPTRRPRKIASTKSRRTDTLKLMSTMPLDVLFEVNPAMTTHGAGEAHAGNRYLAIFILWMYLTSHEPHTGSVPSSCLIHLYQSGSPHSPTSRAFHSVLQT